MSTALQQRLHEELSRIVLIDPHSHINPHAAASKTLADILGYHYYTELAHSAGLPKNQIEQPGLDPKEKVARLVPALANVDNCEQMTWFLELSRRFFGFNEDRLTVDNWEKLYDTAAKKMAQPDWEETVLQQSGLEKVFLTNDFDDPLSGFDTDRYVPCLRTDDLVFHLAQGSVRERLAKATGIEPVDAASLERAIGRLFEHFVRNKAKACAISLPPNFSPKPIPGVYVESALQGLLMGRIPSADEMERISCFVFWCLAEYCSDYQIPFDLMIGVNRRVYRDGVYQGQDLYNQQVSLIQYQELFNAFPQVKFPISVLATTSNQELVSYSWIFPNVIAHGHWWYSNIPCYIEGDCRARATAMPRNKNIGYYSDMYKLEFGWPKFDMYRKVLAKVLADEFVISRRWSETRALELGRQILRGNVESIFQIS